MIELAVLRGFLDSRLRFSASVGSRGRARPRGRLALCGSSLGTVTGLFVLSGRVLAIPGGLLSAWIGKRRFIVVCLAAMAVGGMFVDKFGRPNVVIVAGVLISRLGLLLVMPWSNSVALLLALMVALTVIGSPSAGPIVATASQVLRPKARAAV